MAGLYQEEILGEKQKAELARKLREHALTNAPQGQMISGWFTPPSWTQGLANALQVYKSRMEEDEANQKVLDLEKQRDIATIQGMNQAGITAPQSLALRAGTPEQSPTFLNRASAFLRGENQPQTIPAQPYQQNVAQNVTPEQRDAAIMNMYGINPEMAAPMMQHEQFKLQQQQAKDLREQALADKKENREFLAEQYRLNREDKAEQAQANRDLRIALAGNRQPTQAFGIETVNGMPMRINKVTGQVEPLTVPGMPQAAPKLTEDQAKASGWLTQATNAYNNMVNAKIVTDEQSNPVIDPATGLPKENDINPTFYEAVAPKGSEVENYMRSGPRQRYMQGAESLSEALLRAATGSGVNESEAKQKANELTPRWSDDPATRLQKERAIPVYLESLKVRSGQGAKGAEQILQEQGVQTEFKPKASVMPDKSAIQAEIERRQKQRGQ